MCIVDAYSTSACFWHSSKYVITHHSIVSSTTAWDISLKTPQFSLSLSTHNSNSQSSSTKPQFHLSIHSKNNLHLTITMYRSAILRQTRYFSTTPRFQKSAVDAGKDAIKKVDRVVSDTLVGAIETGGELLCG